MEDLAGLTDHLPLLGRVSAFAHGAGERDHVARDRTIPDVTGVQRPAPGFEIVVRPAGALGPLFVELADARLAGAGHGLIARDDHAADTGNSVERSERDQRHGGRAIGRRHDAAGHLHDVLGVDLRDHQRYVGFHAEGRRLVDDTRAAPDCSGRPLECERIVDIDHNEVETIETAVGEHLTDDLTIAEGQ